jgi:hypothetical protein
VCQVGKPDQPRGKDGRWVSRGGGTVAAAAALALALFAGGGGLLGVGSGAGSAGSGSSVGNGARAQGGSGSSARGKARDRSTARVTARLVKEGLQVRERGVDARTDCVAHSYGEVQDYFRAHPCTALFRALFEVRDSRGGVALVAVAWVDMPDPGQAGRLKVLMDRDGGGNVTELSRENGGQRFTGQHYRSAIEDSTVVNVQAEPIGRAAAALALARTAADLAA